MAQDAIGALIKFENLALLHFKAPVSSAWMVPQYFHHSENRWQPVLCLVLSLFSVPLSLVLVCIHFKGESSLSYKGDRPIFYTYCAEYLLSCSL